MSDQEAQSTAEPEKVEPKIDEETKAPIKRMRIGVDMPTLEMNAENGGKKYTVVVPPWEVLLCAKVDGADFLVGKSFVKPTGGEALQGLAKKLGELSDPYKLVAFGHSDSSGNAGSNQTLSERRAKAAFAMATGDIDTWMAVHDEESWGLDTVQTVLLNLGHPAGPIDGEDGPKTQGGVKSYQEKKGLSPADGKATPALRKALFSDYLAKFKSGITADQFHDPKHTGCGDKNPLAGVAGAHESNRRVVFFAFKSPRLPTVPSGGALTEFYDKIAKDCCCEELSPLSTPLGAKKGAKKGAPFLADCKMQHQGS